MRVMFIVLDGTDSDGTDAGDNVVLNGTDSDSSNVRGLTCRVKSLLLFQLVSR